MTKLVFRLATVEDTTPLIKKFALPLAKDITDRSGLTPDEHGITHFITNFIASNTKPLLACHGKKIAGALLVVKDKLFYAQEPVLLDFGLYIQEKYKDTDLQGENIASKLTEWAINIARANNLIYLPSNITGDPYLDQVYQSLGGQYLGGRWKLQ